MLFWIFRKLFDEFINFIDLFFVLLFLQKQRMLLQKQQIDAIQPFKVIIGGINELVIIALHWYCKYYYYIEYLN